MRRATTTCRGRWRRRHVGEDLDDKNDDYVNDNDDDGGVDDDDDDDDDDDEDEEYERINHACIFCSMYILLRGKVTVYNQYEKTEKEERPPVFQTQTISKSALIRHTLSHIYGMNFRHTYT